MYTFPEITEYFQHPQRGVVESLISTTEQGRVSAMGTSWFAELHEPREKSPNLMHQLVINQRVWVVGRRDNTLLVVPV